MVVRVVAEAEAKTVVEVVVYYGSMSEVELERE